MTAWRTFIQTLAKNPISTFAVLCVAATGVFLGYMTHRTLDVLESPGWCGTAINAERISPGETFVGLTTCVELLKIQLEAVSTGFHINTAGFVFVLIVLVVVVIAGARASGKIGPTGAEFDVGRDAAKAARQVADAAHDEAKDIEESTEDVGAGRVP